MKNKWMSREVQRTIPEMYLCQQCGVAKIFCSYFDGNVNHDWRDPGVIGVVSIITHKHDYSSYIRLYELDNVC